MLKAVKQHKGLMAIVFLSCSLSIALTLFRFIIAGAPVYAFLFWNLFLALIPFWTSLIIYKSTSRWKMILLLAFWLLFFPNAPYLITDLFHYRHIPPVPKGYDMGLLVSYAWCGFVLGHLSIIYTHEAIKRLFNNIFAWILILVSLFLGAFGIYLGRFLRWNSWDVLFKHEHLFRDIYNIISDPYTFKLPWAVTFLTFAFLLLSYLFMEQLISFGRQQERQARKIVETPADATDEATE